MVSGNRSYFYCILSLPCSFYFLKDYVLPLALYLKNEPFDIQAIAPYGTHFVTLSVITWWILIESFYDFKVHTIHIITGRRLQHTEEWVQPAHSYCTDMATFLVSNQRELDCVGVCFGVSFCCCFGGYINASETNQGTSLLGGWMQSEQHSSPVFFHISWQNILFQVLLWSSLQWKPLKQNAMGIYKKKTHLIARNVSLTSKVQLKHKIRSN